MIASAVLLFFGWLLVDASQEHIDDFFFWVYCIPGIVALLSGIVFLAEALV